MWVYLDSGSKFDRRAAERRDGLDLMVIALTPTAFIGRTKIAFSSRGTSGSPQIPLPLASHFPSLTATTTNPTPSQLAVTQTQQPLTFQRHRSVRPQPQIQANPTTSASTTTDVKEEEMPDEDEYQADEQLKTPEQTIITPCHLALKRSQHRHQFRRHQQFKPCPSRSSPDKRQETLNTSSATLKTKKN